MSEWRKVKLGDICQIIDGDRGKNYPKNHEFFESGYCLFLNTGNVTKEGFSFANNQFITKEKDELLRKGKIQRGDLILTTRGTVGNIAYYTNLIKYENVRINSGMVILRVNKENVDASFLYQLVRSKESRTYINSFCTGSAQPQLPIKNLSQIGFEIPPLPIQHRIATILSRYDSLIENYQKQIKLLEEAAQRLYKEWFVDLHFPGHENTKIIDGVPEGWKKKKLVDFVDVQYGYAFDGKLFNSNGEGMPILRIRNIPDGITSDYTTEEASKNYIVHNGDIVVGMDGIFHINSWSGDDAYLVQRACSFRPKEECMKGFIFQAIQEPIKFFEKTLVGATVAHLGKKHIDSIELCIPKNFELYQPFSKFYSQRQGLLSQIRLLTEARDRLLPKLMNGEIKV
jgi:type I restriction enzyme S subunit